MLQVVQASSNRTGGQPRWRFEVSHLLTFITTYIYASIYIPCITFHLVSRVYRRPSLVEPSALGELDVIISKSFSPLFAWSGLTPLPIYCRRCVGLCMVERRRQGHGAKVSR